MTWTPRILDFSHLNYRITLTLLRVRLHDYHIMIHEENYNCLLCNLAITAILVISYVMTVSKLE